MIWIRPDLRGLFGGLDFDGFLALGQRTVKRSADGSRHTAAFVRRGGHFYVKAHHGLGWLEIARSALQGKRPILDARVEVRALTHCAALGIPVPELAAWGARGANPATRQSFVVTAELSGAERASSLLPEAARDFTFRSAFTRRLATVVARLHGAALAHQDLYLEHVFVRRDALGHFELFLLDLHRMLPAAPARSRWRIKDLAALHGSARALGATRSDAARFLRAYSGAQRLAASERELWRRCARRAR